MLNFLKPGFWKIVLTLVLFFASSAAWSAILPRFISDTFPMGFPLQFFVAWGPCPPGQNCSESNTLYLILDLLIWYVIAAFIVSRFQKQR